LHKIPMLTNDNHTPDPVNEGVLILEDMVYV
jgi:hypothetical protein